MKNAVQELFDYLTNRTEFSSVMGDKLFPIVALEGNDFPLSTYRITLEPFSKDADKASFTLAFCFNKWIDCVDFTDAMVPVLGEKYDVLSSTVDWNEEFRVYIGIINIEK